MKAGQKDSGPKNRKTRKRKVCGLDRGEMPEHRCYGEAANGEG